MEHCLHHALAGLSAVVYVDACSSRPIAENAGFARRSEASHLGYAGCELKALVGGGTLDHRGVSFLCVKARGPAGYPALVVTEKTPQVGSG